MLRTPLPPGLKIVATNPAGTTMLLTLQCTLPLEIVDDLAETLELAARMTGSDKLGAQLAAVTAECRSTWLAVAPPPKVKGDLA
jgi:hypothetical protein